jgi:hypothetical protein
MPFLMQITFMQLSIFAASLAAMWQSDYSMEVPNSELAVNAIKETDLDFSDLIPKPHDVFCVPLMSGCPFDEYHPIKFYKENDSNDAMNSENSLQEPSNKSPDASLLNVSQNPPQPSIFSQYPATFRLYAPPGQLVSFSI